MRFYLFHIFAGKNKNAILNQSPADKAEKFLQIAYIRQHIGGNY